MHHFDHIVIGGGIFGCYAALYLAGRGARVAIVEKEDRLFRKASLVNQARLHGGYHYPRSVATAAMSDEHKARFTDEHRAFVNFRFEKYYAIDRFGSFTDPAQFERFCDYLHIRCERMPEHPLFNFERLEALYLTEEYS
ncbi:MAG TPA: FAD-dependent oxidoreductase, partial [Saprospiraceae bacterium]|nr:FAD-dependent oxidoreductase [Saprospiraceae bacterium]